jgi:hypothetical protein
MKRFYKRKPKQKREQVIAPDENVALRAFISPDLYPFLLCCYKEEGKTEAMLNADIKNAQEQYDELCEMATVVPVKPEVSSPDPPAPVEPTI